MPSSCLSYFVIALLSCTTGLVAEGPSIRANAAVPITGVKGPYGDCTEALKSVKGEDLVREVLDGLGSAPDAFFLQCASSSEIRRLVKEIRAAAPDISLVGACTNRGFFVNSKNARLGPCMLVGLKGEGGVRITTASTTFTNGQDLVIAGRNLGRLLRPEQGKGLLLILTDAVISHGYRYNPVLMYKALQKELGLGVAIAGGNAKYGKNSLIVYNDHVSARRMAAIMISGTVEIKMIQEPGKEPVTGPITITKLYGSREIVELDGKPWKDVYQKALAKYVKKEDFEKVSSRNRKPGDWGKLSGRFPYAVVKEHDQLFVRLAHGLAPWGNKLVEPRLPIECYDLKIGDKIVITRLADDQLGCVKRGLRRLNSEMPEGENILFLFPSESNFNIINDGGEKFLAAVKSELATGATTLGFFPCGEHGAWYERDKDPCVGEARYHQLSYPMARVVATTDIKPIAARYTTHPARKAPAIAINKLGRPRARLFYASSRYFIRNWALLGPFYFSSKDVEVGNIGGIVDRRFVANEGELEPQEGKEVVDGRKWLCYVSSAAQPEIIDLDNFYHKPDNAVAYAVAYLYSPATITDGVLLCGSDDFIRIWVNGRLVHTYNEKRRGTEPDTDVIRGVNLFKGWNRIVVKCADVVFDWSFCIRIAPPAKPRSRNFGGYRVSAPRVEPKVAYKLIPRATTPPPGKIVDVIDLAGQWLLKADPEGVSAREKWQDPALKTSDWKKVKVPGDFDAAIGLLVMGKLCAPFTGFSMTQQGLYNGIAWLRREVNVPATWKGKRIFLELERIDDMDVTYFNGNKVGQTDAVSNPSDFWKAPRKYEVKPKFVRFGEKNLIALMILDNNAKGGVYGPLVRLVCQEPK